jgi:hypothetical protein
MSDSPEQLASEAAELVGELMQFLKRVSPSYEVGCLAASGLARTMEAVLRDDPEPGRWAHYQRALALMHDDVSGALDSEDISEGDAS